MCGRYQLGLRGEMSEHGPGFPASEFLRSVHDVLKLAPPRWNIAPTQNVLVMRALERGTYETTAMRWGLLPSWARDKKAVPLLFNARSETVASVPAFRNAFRSRRCLIPATGFIEWEPGTKPKQPWRIFMRDERPFVFAGLWETWVDKATGEVVESCTILTTRANELVEPLHERMPVILPEGAHERWVDRDATREELEPLLVPHDASTMDRYRVSTQINVSTYSGDDGERPQS